MTPYPPLHRDLTSIGTEAFDDTEPFDLMRPPPMPRTRWDLVVSWLCGFVVGAAIVMVACGG
jgi:hypothetical protein